MNVIHNIRGPGLKHRIKAGSRLMFIPDTGFNDRVARLDRVDDSRTKKYVLKSVYRDKKTRDEVMKYLCRE